MGNPAKPAEPSGSYELAKEYVRHGQYDEAERLLEQCLAAQETAGVYRNLALIWRARGNPGRAFECLDKAVDIDEHDDASLALMAELHFDKGDMRQAIGHYVLAIGENKNKPAYKERFLAMAGTVPFGAHNEVMQETLLECLKTPGIDCTRAQILWYTLLTCDPVFAKVYKVSKSGGYAAFNRQDFDKVSDWRPLLSPFFLAGLKKLAVYNLAFEEFLTHLRLRLSEEIQAKKPKLAHKDLAQLAAALAQYCFYTEYIFDASPQEEKFVNGLREKLENDPASQQDAALVSIFACYAPLHSLKNSATIAHAHAPGPIADLVVLQINEHAELVKLRQMITPLTGISAGVSAAVREQYEEFPYPRWRTVARFINDEEVEGRFRGAKAKILNAGCGTGAEAMTLAAIFPDANVLAVDLSLTSLSYAAGKARELGIKNISFHQADILKLDALEDKYDYVSSSGVLHHMENPMQGWKILAGLLKDDGVMRIALYSKTARRHIEQAHKVIAKQGFKPDAAGMKQFRRMMPQLLDRAAVENISNRPDFYHLSMFRDLLFHVQEHRYDIPEIKKCLDELGLEFVKFFLPPQAEKYFAQNPAAATLENCQKYEHENPDAFGAMYQFWCKKKG